MQIQTKPQALEPTKITNKGALLVESHEDKQRPKQSNTVTNVSQHKQFTVLSRWSELATITKSLAEYEQSERSLRQLYSQLQKLEQQVNGKQALGNDSQQLALRVKQSATLMSNLATRENSGLDSQLQASSANRSFTRQLPANVDLLSLRPHDEKIQLMMGRSGKHITIELPAGQSPQQNLAKLQVAFAPHQIEVKKSVDQQLNFTADSLNAWPLKEPWVMTGEGVRIAAGNPVSVSLTEPAHALDKLKQLSEDKVELALYRDEIRKVQRQIQSSLQKMNEQRQRLQLQLQQIQQPVASQQDMLLLSQSIQDNTRIPNQSAVSIIVSQANATRNLIAFSLKSAI